jgi:hypothetical protein
VTCGGGLAGVDVSDDDDVDMSLFLTHGGGWFERFWLEVL